VISPYLEKPVRSLEQVLSDTEASVALERMACRATDVWIVNSVGAAWIQTRTQTDNPEGQETAWFHRPWWR
jgi:hypothetical protein